MPVKPSKPASMVRAECWMLSERTVEVLLRTVSPRPHTELVSSRRSRSAGGGARRWPRRCGAREVAGESKLRGLSKPTTETTPSSCSSSTLRLDVTASEEVNPRLRTTPNGRASGLNADGLDTEASSMASSSAWTRISSSLTSCDSSTGLGPRLSASSSAMLISELGLKGPRTVRMLLAVFMSERSAAPPVAERLVERRPPPPPAAAASRWLWWRMRSRLSCRRLAKVGAVPACDRDSAASSTCDSSGWLGADAACAWLAAEASSTLS
mmetsp:Transcript_34312/g.94797  ORF Transcript_34312/g.94797 Transcript_34312/m.94797 type:complete len:268 (+) Transcript_34312:498-1301(+)